MMQRYKNYYTNPARIWVDEKFVMGVTICDGMNETANISTRQVNVKEGKLLAIMNNVWEWHKKKKPL